MAAGPRGVYLRESSLYITKIRLIIRTANRLIDILVQSGAYILDFDNKYKFKTRKLTQVLPAIIGTLGTLVKQRTAVSTLRRGAT